MEFYELHNLPVEMPQSVQTRLKKNSFSDDERLYCTMNVWMATRQSTGLDPEVHKDRWHLLLRIAKRLGFKKVQEVEPSIQMHAPATFSWQSLFEGKEGRIDIIDYPPMARSERLKAITRSLSLPMSKTMSHEIDELRHKLGWDLFTMEEPGESLADTILTALHGVTRKAQKMRNTKRHSGAIPIISDYMSSCYHALRRLGQLTNK